MYLPLRKVATYVVVAAFLGVGFQKGPAPFVKFFKLLNSKNQEVFGVLFVKLSSHKKVSAGMGRVAP